MKKITFILLALITGTTFAQDTASDNATVSAGIVSVITISNEAGLNFGKVISDATGGTVIIAPDDARTGTAQFVTVATSNPSAASFTVNAADNYTYNVTYNMSGVLTSGANTMVVDTFTNDLGTDSRLGTGGDETMTVGATLTVGANQAVGPYLGTLNVQVAYE
jgi:hypothetical protein